MPSNHPVGLPHGVVQAVITQGSDVGSVIIPNARIQAVIFTGSLKTAAMISQTLAERGGDQVPFIAETGGQNCMLVDSTALPEQVIDDVITMLKGALAELHVGNPEKLRTDVGPVIDQKALDSLNAHSDYMKPHGQLLYQCDIADELTNILC